MFKYNFICVLNNIYNIDHEVTENGEKEERAKSMPSYILFVKRQIMKVNLISANDKCSEETKGMKE